MFTYLYILLRRTRTLPLQSEHVSGRDVVKCRAGKSKRLSRRFSRPITISDVVGRRRRMSDVCVATRRNGASVDTRICIKTYHRRSPVAARVSRRSRRSLLLCG